MTCASTCTRVYECAATSCGCMSENTSRKRYVYKEVSVRLRARAVEGGRRKKEGPWRARSNQDLRFIMYNAQEREGEREPYLFLLSIGHSASRLPPSLLAPYPSGFLHFLFLFLSLPPSPPSRSRMHARTHVDAFAASAPLSTEVYYRARVINTTVYLRGN